MPVLVIGADASIGSAVLEALSERDGEVRAFVSDVLAAERLRSMGCKVALGDVSDASHIAAAALGCFSIVCLTEAAHDDRERSFATSPDSTMEAWREAIEETDCRRVIWVETAATSGSGAMISGMQKETAVVQAADRADQAVGAEVAALDDAAQL